MRFAIRAICLAVLIAIIDGRPLESQTTHATNPCGRYQLFQGSIPWGSGEATGVIMKIDTQTGQTWVYIQGANVAFDHGGWLPIQEFKRQ